MEIQDQAAKIVSITKKSTLANKFLEIPRNLGPKPKKLMQEVATRWNSFYEMFERLLKLRDA